MKEIKYTGAGLNGPSLIKAVNRSVYSPSKNTVPAGASWPFVTLTLKETGAEFKLAHIRRTAVPSNVTVSLSRYGYFFFHTPNASNDFGFVTLKMGSLANELRIRGFHLDDSCQHNMTISRINLYLLTAMPLIFFVIIMIMIALKPNGI